MGKTKFGAGDIVQALAEITSEEQEKGKWVPKVCAKPRGVGHVLQVTREEEDTWLIVHWERTGMTCEVNEIEVKRLGGPDTGKKAA